MVCLLEPFPKQLGLADLSVQRIRGVDDIDLPRELCIKAVWFDEHMIELAAVVKAAPWWGQAAAYTVPADIAQFAGALKGFAEGGPPAAFEAGAESGYGLISLQFFRIDRAGHVACFARLASSSAESEHRPEHMSKLAVEFRVETWGVIQFSEQLARLGRTQSGQANLRIEP